MRVPKEQMAAEVRRRIQEIVADIPEDTRAAIGRGVVAWHGAQGRVSEPHIIPQYTADVTTDGTITLKIKAGSPMHTQVVQGRYKGALFNELVALTRDRNVVETALSNFEQEWPADRTGAWEKYVLPIFNTAKKRPGTAKEARRLQQALSAILLGGSSSDTPRALREAFRGDV